MKLILLACLLLVLGLGSCKKTEHFDIVIKGGSVLDGSGSPAVKTDIGIREGKIVSIKNLSDAQATQTIDATGLTVSPGFIDLHAHIEPIMSLPDAESNIRQGVTTAVGGPDGGGPWPFGSYLDSLDNHFKLGINVAYLTGHNVIRYQVMQNAARKPTDAELNAMKEMVKQAMEEGAFGLSTGLKYMPGTFAKTSEVIELSNVAAGMKGFYTSHLREEGLGLLAGVREAIVIGKESGIPIVLTHHKAMGKPMWGKSIVTLGLVDSARSVGIDVMMDQYPYTASSTGLSVLIPTWAMAGTREEFIKRTKRKSTYDSIMAAIRFNLENDRGGGDIKMVQFSMVEWDTTLNGKTLYDYAVRKGVAPNVDNGAKLVLELELKGSASCIFHAMSEEDVERIMKHTYTMIASDGETVKFGVGHPHPRAYGTFPRVLGRYVREKKIITLEDAIRKMTSLPASRMGLTDRGLLKEGYVADITIFDADKVIDKGTFEKPHQYPEGIEYVIVNGVVTVEKGTMTKNRGGKVLRGPSYSTKP